MKPKRLAVTLFGCAVLSAVALLPRESVGQAGDDDAAVQQLLADVVAQQSLITENQARVDEKVAALAEEIRLARIYAGRAGGKAK